MQRGRVLLGAIVLLTCCSRGPRPEEVVSKFLDASYHGRHEEAHGYLSTKDRAFKPLDAYRSENTDAFALLLASKASFAVKETKVEGDRATVRVAVSAPDLTGAMADVMGAAFAGALAGGKDQSKVQAALARKLEDKGLPLRTEEHTFNLVREETGWKIHQDFETQAKIAKVLEEPESLESRKKLADAKLKYEEALRLSPANTQATGKIKELTPRIAAAREQEAYFPKVEIRGVTVNRGKGFMGPYAFAEGEVKNLGDHTLKRLDLTIECLDDNGKVVFEKEDTVLLATSDQLFSSRDFSKPLKPNYSRKFLADLKDAPSDWGGRVSVRVSSLEFEAP